MREQLAGWWDVAVEDGDSSRRLAQYTSEFQAREAGRVNAVRFAADLIIHQTSGPTTYQRFDAGLGALTAPSLDPDARS